MANNMSYCRFENTFGDLEDCAEHIHDNGLSESEKRYRVKLLELVREMAEEVDGMDLEDDLPE